MSRVVGIDRLSVGSYIVARSGLVCASSVVSAVVGRWLRKAVVGS